ncbi:hypothetical protein [Sphingopyxis sp.]|uniref:hypothetical protein n=1 Tax=Sphingopyxis sp. TaxID=1908224 RepID=UPI002B4846ED|nr:hypothetical protein [Sphingopyxis sp.]HJS12931.1 hypothetical protein [Sphingopyxis sp.]
MKKKWPVYAAVLITPAFSADTPSIIVMNFGTTSWGWNTDKPASDYIAGFGTKIPKAARICQVALLGFNGGITDGGEAAYFRSNRDSKMALECLKRWLPQGSFGIVSPEDWNEMKRAIPEFPRPLEEIDRIELPPPEAEGRI